MCSSDLLVRSSIAHLVDLGHSRIAFLHGIGPGEDHYVRDLRQRYQFFFEELGQCGLVAYPELLAYGGWNRTSGYKAMKQLLAEDCDFSAVIISDHVASGVYQAIHEAGRVIPDDISVIGHDDLSWSSHLQPPLTTVRVSRDWIAREAVERLMNQQIKDEFEVTIPVKLIVRESTAPWHSRTRPRPRQQQYATRSKA